MQPQGILWIELEMGQNDFLSTMYDPCTQPDDVVCRSTGLEGFLHRRVRLFASTCNHSEHLPVSIINGEIYSTVPSTPSAYFICVSALLQNRIPLTLKVSFNLPAYSIHEEFTDITLCFHFTL